MGRTGFFLEIDFFMAQEKMRSYYLDSMIKQCIDIGAWGKSWRLTNSNKENFDLFWSKLS